MITRFLNLQSNDNIPQMTSNEIIRQANRFGLLKSNLIKWTEYRQKRNATSQTYDENVANEVIAIIPEFKTEAEFLLSKLKEQNI